MKDVKHANAPKKELFVTKPNAQKCPNLNAKMDILSFLRTLVVVRLTSVVSCQKVIE